jgi:uncharacterized protein (TIGR00297 family)
MGMQYIIVGIAMAFASYVSVAKSKLDKGGGVAGWLTGMLIFVGTGWCGLSILVAFFVLGTLSTSIGLPKKASLGLVAEKDSKRTAGQVFANGGPATILAILAVVSPTHHAIFLLMVAASFSSATADTMSSELGNLYGKSFYKITNLKKDIRGLDGVVSIEGTVFGVIGSCAIAGIYSAFNGLGANAFIIIVAGTIGNIADSLLGATAERKKLIGNNVVNFMNTAIGAIAAYLMDRL